MIGVSRTYSRIVCGTTAPKRGDTKIKKKGIGENMKFIAFWKYDPKDERTLIEKFKTLPKFEIQRIMAPHILVGRSRGFSLFEAENLEQVEVFCHYYAPEMEIEFYPIVEASKFIPIRDK
jgi:hypothetical protein